MIPIIKAVYKDRIGDDTLRDIVMIFPDDGGETKTISFEKTGIVNAFSKILEEENKVVDINFYGELVEEII